MLAEWGLHPAFISGLTIKMNRASPGLVLAG